MRGLVQSSRDPFYTLGWTLGNKCRKANAAECGHEPTPDGAFAPEVTTPSPQQVLF